MEEDGAALARSGNDEKWESERGKVDDGEIQRKMGLFGEAL